MAFQLHLFCHMTLCCKKRGAQSGRKSLGVTSYPLLNTHRPSLSGTMAADPLNTALGGCHLLMRPHETLTSSSWKMLSSEFVTSGLIGGGAHVNRECLCSTAERLISGDRDDQQPLRCRSHDMELANVAFLVGCLQKHQACLA